MNPSRSRSRRRGTTPSPAASSRRSARGPRRSGRGRLRAEGAETKRSRAGDVKELTTAEGDVHNGGFYRLAALKGPPYNPQMEFRQLGHSGLKVPVLSFGTGTFGGNSDFFRAWGETD